MPRTAFQVAAPQEPASNEDPFNFLRPRGGDSSYGFGEDDDAPPSAQPQPLRRRAAANQSRGRSTNSEFQPGAIVRVKMKNFVTYEEAEFYLGPNLNMIIGPNGTGKSSLVCAICLGLGFPPSVLGRATTFSEFVKHGHEEAEIEIELQRKPEDPENYVVGLCIRAENNSRQFSIGGRKVSHKDVQQLMHSLRIQVDNLCQFLPQDRVAEFAGLTPAELLEKTLHATAPEEMIDQQKQLKELFKAQKETRDQGESARTELRKLQARQQVLEADVQRLRERDQIQKKINDLSKLMPLVKYWDARRKYKEANNIRKEAERKLKRLELSVAPALEAVNKKQKYFLRMKEVVKHHQHRLQEADKSANEALEDVEKADTAVKNFSRQLEAEDKKMITKKEELRKVRQKISQLEEKYKQPPRPFNAEDFNLRIREKRHELREKDEEVAEANDEYQKFKASYTTANADLSKAKADLQSLESKEGQALKQLWRLNSDVARVWEWLKDNQKEFSQEVFGPPFLTCSVKDPRYSDLIQAVLQQDDFFCFTTQNTRDLKRLNHQIYKELKVSAAVRASERPLSSYQPPIPREQLAEMGFDGYILDFLEGPEPVLAMLCANRNIHASLVSVKDITDDQAEQARQNPRIGQFVVGRRCYRTTRRPDLGPSAVSTRVTVVQKGRYWTDQPVDEGEKAGVQRRINELEQQLAEFETQTKAAFSKLKQLRIERGDIDKAIEEIEAKKRELQEETTQWQSLPTQIENEKVNLERVKRALADCRDRKESIQRDIEQATLNRAKAVLKHHAKLSALRQAWHDLLEARLISLEAESEFAALDAKNAEIKKRLEEERETLREAREAAAKAKEVASNLLEEVKRVMSEGNQEDLGRRAEGVTIEQLENAIEAERTKLEVIQASNPAALEEYQAYEQRIQNMTKTLATQEQRLTELTQQIKDIMSEWEPRLDELVGRINDAFSYNFEQISCAGEVSVYKDEDFDKWAIDIKVRFRPGETLQRLDQHRQSGGERAVSTIFYLMALQSMAQAPFRVVDEINQGMDPRNERMVHERMVEVACREHTSQYLLITPKLLSGLRYDERMRVHTIVSGEHVDERGTELMNFGKFADIQKRLMRRS